MLCSPSRRLIAVSLVVGCLAAGGLAVAQTGTSKTKSKKPLGPAAIEALNRRAEQLGANLYKEADDISKGFEEAGDYERAKTLLEVLLKLDPKNAKLKERIEQLTDKMLDSSEFEYELDVSRAWSAPVGVVTKDKLVRIEASGDYKFVSSITATPEGLPTDDAGNDLIGSLPVGALIGVIINAETKKPEKPFEIKAKREWTPRQTGYLQLRVNVPNGHKCTGKLKVKLSGVTKLPT
jgi:hypothetical protein